MFWRFGGYAAVSAIDTILDKQEVTLEELLDESDLIQELKQHNTKLIEYLREDKILEKLLEYVVAPKVETPVSEEAEVIEETTDDESKGKERSFSKTRETEDEEDEKEKKRNRYSYVSAEVLSSDNWSICEALMENQGLLRKFWEFMKMPIPLDPLQASYFTKVNEALLDKKTEEMLDLFKSLDNAVNDMLQHVDSPMVMDLLLKIISLDKQEGGTGIVDWLHAQGLMPTLLSFLSSEHSWATQTSAGDFLKAIITISANASQNEQSCIGPNALTRQLVSQPCIEKLISDMLKGGNPLTVGVGIVIEVIRKNNSDYDPDVGADPNAVPSSKDPIYLGTLLRMFAQRVPDFMDLILSPNHTVGGGDGPVSIKRKELSAAFGGKIEPLGFDRFKTCELMAELLHCSNMGLLNEIGSEEFVKARDIERERLKAEGKLGISHSQPPSPDDDLTMKSSTQTRLGSPDGSRKLEIQNATDDDGFEEVTRDQGDETKDEFEESPDGFIIRPAEVPLYKPLKKTSAPLSFLNKDDEEFVDEPLSSPRLNNVELAQPNQSEAMELTPLPLSPTKELSSQVGSLGLKDEDTAMTSPPSIDSHTEESEASTSESKHSPESSEESAPIPARTEEKTEEASLTQPTLAPETLESLPHPEDKPAPLFAKKSEPSEEPTPPVDAPEQNTSSETLDTTMGEAGDSSNSIMMGNTDDHQQSVMEEVVTPVVGDFLKMQFVEHKVVPTILDFFFRFPWNNFLHNVVYDVVQQVFNGPMDRGFNRSLSIDLFETGDITMRIVDGQKKSDEAQEKNRMRLGYMGHLTLIAEEVVKFTERHPPELLSDSVLEKVMNGEWITYVEVTLAETRERDNAILGGVRPDMSVGPRQAVMNAVNAANNFGGASSALTEAGLNGAAGLDSIDLANGNGATGSGFTLSGGTLLSGFGSSSDEEDEDMDEDNEDDGSKNSSGAAEFSRYITTPSTTTATSSDLEPPSAPPPPPPPLNIPPSRARRQLAARLALHSKQNAEQNLDNAEAEKVEHRKDLDPFATDEDDDSDAEDNDFTIGDLEVEEEGKGHLPAGTELVGKDEPLLGGGEGHDKNVGIHHLDATPSLPVAFDEGEGVGDGGSWNGSGAGSGVGRANFPSMWPFGEAGGHYDRNHFRGASKRLADDGMQSSDESDSDEDNHEFGGEGQEGAGAQYSGKRRLSVTTEAKRRTILEDDDEDEETVHVAMAEASAEEEAGKEKVVEGGDGDDGELVEIQHKEIQGVGGE